MFCQKCGTKNPDNGKFCRNCGIDLNGNQAVSSSELIRTEHFVDLKGQTKSNDPDELWSAGLKNMILGVGFLIVAIVLLLTNVAGGRNWWWTMLIPAFSMLATGVGGLSKSKRIEKKKTTTFVENNQNQFTNAPLNASLPPPQTEYAKPRTTIYDTGELVPPSVIENTTRHLEINREGETMTLPNKDNS